MNITPKDQGRARLRLKIAVDAALWVVAVYAAIPLRIPGRWANPEGTIPAYVAACIPVSLAIILCLGLQRQSWRRVAVADLERLVVAVGVGTLIMFVIGLALYRLDTGFPRTVPLIGGALALLALTAARLLTRIWHERRPRASASHDEGPKRVLLVGAGGAGARMAREIRGHGNTGMTVVGFLDDDPVKRRLTIGGVGVLGQLDDLPPVATTHSVEEILIAMPSASGAITRRVVDLAALAGVPCRILPGLTEILAGDVSVSRIRTVQVEDLLRREPVELDLPSGLPYVDGGVVLVTGAGGSIGSELARQVARLRPRHLVLFDHSENALYQVDSEIENSLPHVLRTTIVGDIRDPEKVAEVMHRCEPDVVFHAAANKHVPLMEEDPDEAILSNVGGTRNVARAARVAGVSRFVNVSTDKAVRPVSVLGVTKAIAERVVHAVATEADPRQAFVSVRFGNVLGSSGSVVPLFEEQIRRGGPITVTHPDMTRYFMTIPEASRLVIQAGAMGDNGAVYVLDMGTPVRIIDLAHDMIRLSGYEEGDIGVEFVGLRPGERLNESLFGANERFHPTEYAEILLTFPSRDVEPKFGDNVDELLEAAAARDWRAIDVQLRSLVPGFTRGDSATRLSRHDVQAVNSARSA